MLDALSQDFVRTARAKGLSKVNVALRHALPTAMLPVVSYLGPMAAGILTGSVVVEKIFAVPGLGWHFVQAALSRLFARDGSGAAVHVLALHLEYLGGHIVLHSRPTSGTQMNTHQSEYSV